MVDGADLIGMVWMFGIESPFGKSRRHQWCAANASFWGSVPSAAVVRDRPARRQIAVFALSKTATSPCRTGSLHRLLRLRASGLFPALQGSGALLYAARRNPAGFRLFLGSSAVEHSTVNRMVAGSNPARGAKIRSNINRKSCGKPAIICGCWIGDVLGTHIVLLPK
jgi:hypothetical protein